MTKREIQASWIRLKLRERMVSSAVQAVEICYLS
jgi:hypothetical protein